MLSIKKTVLVILALSNTAVFSGTMGPICDAVNVKTPVSINRLIKGGAWASLLKVLGTIKPIMILTPSHNFSGNFDLLGAGIPDVETGCSYIAPQWDAVNLEFGLQGFILG